MEAPAQNNNSRLILIIVAVCVALILFVYIIGRSSGKNKANKDKMERIDLPTGGQGIPPGWRPEPLAKELHTVMDGIFTMDSTKEATFSKLSTLSKDQITAVYNSFNQMFSGEGDGSLYQWIMDETDSGPNRGRALAALELNGLA